MDASGNVVLSNIVRNGYYLAEESIMPSDHNLIEVTLYCTSPENVGSDAIVGDPHKTCSNDIVLYYLYEKKQDADGSYYMGKRIGMFEALASQVTYDEDNDVILDSLPPPFLYTKHSVALSSISANHYCIAPDTSIDTVTRISLSARNASTPTRRYGGTSPLIRDRVWIREWVNNSDTASAYMIHNNHCDNDSLYISVLQALDETESEDMPEDIGQFRHTVSALCGDELFAEFVKEYETLSVHLTSANRLLVDVSSRLRGIAAALDASPSREERSRLIAESKLLKTNLRDCKEQRNHYRMRMRQYAFMKDVGTVSQFKSAISSMDSPGNDKMLAYLERILNFKAIILSYDAYFNRDWFRIVNCGDKWNKSGAIRPNKYIILEKHNLHYNNVSYAEKLTFSYVELPTFLRERVIDRCIEGGGGLFPFIAEFSDDIRKRESSRPVPMEPYLIGLNLDPRVTLCIHYDAPVTIAGGWIGEMITNDLMMDYSDLNNHAVNWRRALAHEWEQLFALQNMEWLSVSHYLLSHRFSTLSQSGVSIFALKSGTPESKCVRTALKRVSLSEDAFNAAHIDETREAEAVRAKFFDHRNRDLKKLLLKTRDATLCQYIQGHKPRILKALMDLRQRARSATYTMKMVNSHAKV